MRREHHARQTAKVAEPIVILVLVLQTRLRGRVRKSTESNPVNNTLGAFGGREHRKMGSYSYSSRQAVTSLQIGSPFLSLPR